MSPRLVRPSPEPGEQLHPFSRRRFGLYKLGKRYFDCSAISIMPIFQDRASRFITASAHQHLNLARVIRVRLSLVSLKYALDASPPAVAMACMSAISASRNPPNSKSRRIL
jgi:hypothetical protein